MELTLPVGCTCFVSYWLIFVCEFSIKHFWNQTDEWLGIVVGEFRPATPLTFQSLYSYSSEHTGDETHANKVDTNGKYK